ncbi:hypothetical protein ACIKTA_14600, partial [Hansschlegelia beijingensis]
MFDVLRSSPVRRFALGALLACVASGAAVAGQSADAEAPSWVEQRVSGLEQKLAFFGERPERRGEPSYVQPAQSSSMADIAVRLDRLENQMRQLNGRLEQLEFQSRKNDEALKRFQGDVDYRFQDLESGKGGGAKPGRRIGRMRTIREPNRQVLGADRKQLSRWSGALLADLWR